MPIRNILKQIVFVQFIVCCWFSVFLWCSCHSHKTITKHTNWKSKQNTQWLETNIQKSLLFSFLCFIASAQYHIIHILLSNISALIYLSSYYQTMWCLANKTVKLFVDLNNIWIFQRLIPLWIYVNTEHFFSIYF